MNGPPREPAPAGRTRLRSAARWLALAGYALLLLALLVAVLPALFEACYRDYGEDLDQALPSPAPAHYRYIRGHLREPFSGYAGRQVLVENFRVVALSHMACGLTNVFEADNGMRREVAPLLREVATRALSGHVSPYDERVENVPNLGDHGLYLSHLNLILGCYRHVSGDGRYDDLHERVSRHLAALSLRDGDFHAHSWPGSPKWPADQTVTLCSLYLYDMTRLAALSRRPSQDWLAYMMRGGELSRKPIQGWLAYMKEQATDADSGLHRSAITDLDYAHLPRGCALSWSVLYMAQFAPGEAWDLYAAYRKSRRTEILGFGGFREWPRGQARASDVDSGPVVFGAGMAATGLGLGPARIFKDYRTYDGIMRSASTFGLPVVVGAERRHRLSPLLGEAILFHGATARLWFVEPFTPAYPRERAFPTGALILLVLALAACALIAWRLKKLIKLLRGEQVPQLSKSPAPLKSGGEGGV